MVQKVFNWIKSVSNLWPIGLILILVLLLGINLFTPWLPLDTGHFNLQEVPVAGDKFIGGIDLLSPPKAVAIVIYYPDAKGTPQAQMQTFGQVSAVLAGDKPAVIIAVPTESVAELQRDLVFNESKIVYELLPALPTRTPTVTLTATPKEITPTATSTMEPRSGNLYFEIKVADIASRADILIVGKPARLVVVEKINNLVGTPGPFETTDVCVIVNDFLDAKELRLGGYINDKVQSVLIELPSNRLAEVLTSLVRAERTYLLTDSSCSNSSP